MSETTTTPAGPSAGEVLRATPAMIAAAWDAWHARHGGRLGPGPAFAEAINAAVAAAPTLALATDPASEVDALRAERDALRGKIDELCCDGAFMVIQRHVTAFNAADLRATAAEARVKVLEEVLRNSSDYIDTMPAGTYGVTAQMMKIQAALTPPQDRPKENGDAG